MKKFLFAVIFWVCLLILPQTANAETTTEVYIPSELVIIEYVETESKEELLILIATYQKEIEVYNEKLIVLNNFYEYNSPVLQEINNNIIIASAYLSYYKNKYEAIIEAEQEAIWEAKEEEYPVASKIWKSLKEAGYNDYVCAGIMGNIMAEVGGQTLNLKWDLVDKSGVYYGICQWNKNYYPSVWDRNLDYQILYLKESIEYQLDTYGRNYRRNFNYQSFCKLDDAEQAALAFAKCYERCASSTYKIRQENAVIAYNYFVN